MNDASISRTGSSQIYHLSGQQATVDPSRSNQLFQVRVNQNSGNSISKEDIAHNFNELMSKRSGKVDSSRQLSQVLLAISVVAALGFAIGMALDLRGVSHGGLFGIDVLKNFEHVSMVSAILFCPLYYFSKIKRSISPDEDRIIKQILQKAHEWRVALVESGPGEQGENKKLALMTELLFEAARADSEWVGKLNTEELDKLTSGIGDLVTSNSIINIRSLMKQMNSGFSQNQPIQRAVRKNSKDSCMGAEKEDILQTFNEIMGRRPGNPRKYLTGALLGVCILAVVISAVAIGVDGQNVPHFSFLNMDLFNPEWFLKIKLISMATAIVSMNLLFLFAAFRKLDPEETQMILGVRQWAKQWRIDLEAYLLKNQGGGGEKQDHALTVVYESLFSEAGENPNWIEKLNRTELDELVNQVGQCIRASQQVDVCCLLREIKKKR